MTAPLYPQATTAAEITANLAHINARIAAACAACGRDPASVRLLPVSKTVPAERLHYAYEAGIRLLGENKVQEAYDKWQALSALDGLQWAVIGHLQSNKVKYVARFAAEFQALDSLDIAEALDRRLQQQNPAVAELSMGMSGDFELAIAEGATTVRVGQAIFGARRTPDSEYWPGLAPENR